MDIDKVKEAALEAGSQAFNAPSEAEVRALRDRVFVSPDPVLGATMAGELTLCRLALACGVMAKVIGCDPITYWATLKVTALDAMIEPNLTTPEDRAAWKALEGRLLACAFGGTER